MKTLYVLFIAVASLSLEATHYETSMSLTPTTNKNEFLADIQIEKVCEESATRELVASSTMICVVGKPSQLKVESKDKNDSLSIQILVPENNAKAGIQSSILMKEKNEIVLSTNNNIKLAALN